ncbi:expressed unknown protein [Seminavis robusta]|uniref:Uncharacterized protein n=1 Tax=Seminavis robusta TaxID=568900 RepID=A0A9N8EMH4_9STRA|nr:expressed unknown protein [Seminavis robusta]|eukprot:Sro1545_g281270.1 n/a (371) ;mRNA; f:3732-5061
MMKLLATTFFLAVQVYAQPGPKTESQKKQERFYMCIRSIEKANKDGNDLLTRSEYQPFIKQLSVEMFDDSILYDDELPRDLGQLYKYLILESGAGEDDNAINIYGASTMKLAFISQDRTNQLKTVCQIVMKGLAKLGPQTHAPVQMAVEFLTEEESEEEEEDDSSEEEEDDSSVEEEEDDMDTAMVSVHSSFVLYNNQSLAEDDLDIGQDSVLYASFVDFVRDLMDTVCDIGIPCPENKTQSWNSTHSRRLCGDWDRLRRKLCGGLDRRRLGGIIDSADLYEVKVMECPDEYKQNGDHEDFPQCHTIYSLYDVLVEKPTDVEFKAVEENYLAVTDQGIADGMLQDSLQQIDPNTPFQVIGPGKNRHPKEA